MHRRTNWSFTDATNTSAARQRNGSIAANSCATEPAVLWWTTMRLCLALVVAQAVAYSGRTAPGRLAWVDRYLLLRELSVFADDEPSTTRVFCDIGLGDDATTTLELAEALQQDADAPLVVACEADANRCAGAREACAAAGVVVRQTDGSFTLPLKWDEVCVGARAMNVFRSGCTPVWNQISSARWRGG